VQPQRERRAPVRFRETDPDDDSGGDNDEESWGEPESIYSSAADARVLATDMAAAAAACARFAEINPDAPSPASTALESAREFFGTWGAAYAAQHLRFLLDNAELETVSEVISALETEFAVFLSRDDVFKKFNSFSADMMARDSKTSWASIWKRQYGIIDKTRSKARLFAAVAHAFLSIVPHEAAVERTFSAHKRVHGPLRGRLGISHVRDEMMILFGHCRPKLAATRRARQAAEIPVELEKQVALEMTED
jgi:hypothetical protein